MRRIVLLVIFILTANSYIYAEDKIPQIEPITVTSSLYPNSEINQNRNIQTITAQEIKEHGFSSIDEILSYSLADTQSRYSKVQTDLSMRGSTFEQVVVLIDGVPVNNTQTGHFNMNLPVSIDSIDRIEIIPGQSSSLYSNAFGGAVNIITKKGMKQNFGATVSYGSFDSKEASGFAGYAGDAGYVSAGASKETSDGFKRGTQYDIVKSNFRTGYNFNAANSLQMFYGYVNKDFGAYDFYTPGANLPSHETTENHISYLAFNSEIDKLSIKPKLYYNQADDDFILTESNPSYYRAKHETKKYGFDVLTAYSFTKALAVSVLLKRDFDKIESDKLGNHHRNSYSGGAEILFNKDTYGFNASLRNDFYRDENYYSPEAGFYYLPLKWLKLRNSNSLSYRLPSYTELYTVSSKNIGDENLNEEKSISFEIGMDLYFKNIQIKNTAFYRKGSDVIDWVEISPTVWKVQNINRIDFAGAENEIKYTAEIIDIMLKNSYTHIKSYSDYKSKYGLNNSRNNLSLGFALRLPYKIIFAGDTAYKKRAHDSYYLTSLYLDKDIQGKISIFVKANNLFNEKYEEIEGLEQPGREIKAGAGCRI